MATFTIPLTTLQPGTRSFGPVSVPDADSGGAVLLDRAVSSGLNAQPVTTHLTIAIEESNDGGVTWLLLASSGAEGGSIISKYTGLPETGIGVGVSLMHVPARRLRATTTVTGTSVAISGTLTTQ